MSREAESQGPGGNRPSPAGDTQDDPGEALTETPRGDTLAYGSSDAPQEPPRDSHDLRRGARVGRYLVIDRLGAGGMGVVYAAYDPDLDRRVALKLLGARARTSSQVALSRLLREAHAMARLQHPNVITVHDVGTYEGQVFLAMELVEGPSLGAWASSAPRSWQEVLEVYVQAARGLEAIHAAGLLHRDVKPDNVLLGRDGRVRVLDLGLARLTQAEEDELPATSGEEPTRPGPTPSLSRNLTQAGAIVGTPAYMSPEQLAGEPIDARSDQFSFCVALYEALYGERPFEGRNPIVLLREMRADHVRAPNAARKVPLWIRRLLLVGLRAKPAERHASMAALIAALTHRPGTRRRIGAVSGLALAALAAAIVLPGYFRREESRVCAGGERQLAGIWGPARKQSIREAFERTGRPNAGDAWRGVEAVIDAYERAWLTQRKEACEATILRGDQSMALLALRHACLDERLRELESLVQLMSSADADVLDRTVSAAHSLTSLAGCADVEGLTARVKPPGDERTKERVSRIRAQLTRGKELLDLGKYAGGLEIAAAQVAAAAQLPYRPIQAEALWLFGDLQQRKGDLKAAEQTLHEAVWAAEAGRHDEMVVRSSALLAYVLGFLGTQPEAAHRWSRQALAVLERMGKNEELEGYILNNEGLVYEVEGKLLEALAHYERSLALWERALSADHPRRAISHYNLGSVLAVLGRSAEASRQLDLALSFQTRVLGPEHPDVGQTLNVLGDLQRMRGEWGLARKTLERAHRILASAFGEDSADAARPLITDGQVLLAEGRPEPALARLERALEVSRKAYGADHPQTLQAECLIAQALAQLGRPGDADTRAAAAVATSVTVNGEGHLDTARARLVLAEILVTRRPREAIELYRKALTVGEQVLGPESTALAEILLGLGRAALAANEASEAIMTLERALSLHRRMPGAVLERARIELDLARALWSRPDGHARAMDLAKQARDEVATLREEAPSVAAERAALARWLGARITPPASPRLPPASARP